MLPVYYVVAGEKYANKLLAYQKAFEHNWWPHWNYYEEEFSRTDWLTEPQEDLFDLYGQRARQLRESYDRVAVWYSGGADSDNILQSFLRQGLHIDEVWHRTTIEKHNRCDAGIDPTNAAQETILVARPQLKHYLNQYPWWKPQIHELDLTDTAIDHWQQGAVDPFSINYYHPLTLGKKYREVDHKLGLRSHVKTCRIFGVDKPIISYDQGNYYFTFMDSLVHINLMQQEIEYPDPYDMVEFFYWHPNSSKILAKQSHIIKNYFKQNPHLIWMIDSNNPNRLPLSDVGKMIRPLIYPFYDFTLWQSNKPTSEIDIEEWHWFYANNDHPAVANWNKTAKSYSAETINLYNRRPTHEHNYRTVRDFTMLPANYSKFYCVGS